MIPLSHSAATFVIPWEPTDLPAGDAEVVFTVDGTAYHRPVKLPAGMTRDDQIVTVSARDSYAPF